MKLNNIKPNLRCDKDAKRLIIFNKINIDGLEVEFKSLTLKEFIKFLENENIREGIKVIHNDNNLEVCYK